MKAYIPANPPLSGDYPEQWYDAGSFCTRVLFEDENYIDWIGVFGQGDVQESLSKAVLFGLSSNAFVLAMGQGYVVNVNSRVLTHKTDWSFLLNVITIPQRDFVIACDYNELYAYNRTGLIWHSEGFAIDGITFQHADSQHLTGEIWDPADGTLEPYSLYFDDWCIEYK